MKIIEYNTINGSETSRDVDILESLQQPQVSYDQLVSDLIRERYTIDQELAINRQRDTKPEEFQDYFDFCEQCKQQAHETVI